MSTHNYSIKVVPGVELSQCEVDLMNKARVNRLPGSVNPWSIKKLEHNTMFLALASDTKELVAFCRMGTFSIGIGLDPINIETFQVLGVGGLVAIRPGTGTGTLIREAMHDMGTRDSKSLIGFFVSSNLPYYDKPMPNTYVLREALHTFIKISGDEVVEHGFPKPENVHASIFDGGDKLAETIYSIHSTPSDNRKVYVPFFW